MVVTVGLTVGLGRLLVNPGGFEVQVYVKFAGALGSPMDTDSPWQIAASLPIKSGGNVFTVTVVLL